MPGGALRRRVSTRLSWLGMGQGAFARVIGMDPTAFSKTLRADRPRDATLKRLALGLGLSMEDLCSGSASLLSPHPYLGMRQFSPRDIDGMRAWYADLQ